ncbi:hypothetical protein, partial [Staphylococcus aureus]
MIRRPPRSTQGVSSAASDVYKRQRPYKARMILGFSMSFLNAIFIALPIFLAAKIFNNVLSH